MGLGAYLVFRIGRQTPQANAARLRVTIRTEDVHGTALQAWTPIKDAVPVVPIWSRQDVVTFDVLQDRPDPKLITFRCSLDFFALLWRPPCTAGRVDLPLTHHCRSPEIRLWSIGNCIVKIIIRIVHESRRRKRKT